jgi:glycolate oxidase
LNRLLRIDPEAGIAIVQPGVCNLAISEAAAPHGLYYAPDPSSQIACSIGGNVAENAGGVHCLKYGLTVHNVLRVRIVTGEGEVVELGSTAPDMPGLNLPQVFIGSEGMLGLATEVTVRLIPRPPFARVVMASFPGVELAGEGVARIIADGIIPAGLELMDRQATRMVEPFVHAGVRPRCRGDPAVRVGRHARRGRRGSRPRRSPVARGRRNAPAGVRIRSAAAAVLGRAQECIRGRGTHFA